MTRAPATRRAALARLTGKGVFPARYARSLLNPLRALILSPARLVRRLGLERGMTVLEVGPGPGYFSIAAARAVPAGKLLLFDVQQEMLDLARQRLRAAGCANFETHQGDAARLPFADQSVDVAFLVTVLGEVEERDSCLAELHRVLCSDGRLSITEQRGDPDYLSSSVVGEMTSRAGFRHERTFRGFLHYTLNATKHG